jgi:hypothetical protein
MLTSFLKPLIPAFIKTSIKNIFYKKPIEEYGPRKFQKPSNLIDVASAALSNYFRRVIGIDNFCRDRHSMHKGNHYEATRKSLPSF